MSQDSFRSKRLTVSHERHDKFAWSKLAQPNNKRRIVRLLSKYSEGQLLPAKIGLRNESSAQNGQGIQSKRLEDRKKATQGSSGRCFLGIVRDTPSPTAYNPVPNPPNMTIPPSFTIRPKTYPEKAGGDRVAWGKEWFSNCDGWSLRVHFNREHTWPSPADHVPKTTIGSHNFVLRQSPSHSMQGRPEFTLVAKDALFSPGPCAYDRSQSQNKTLPNSPKITIQEGRRNGTLPYITHVVTPGPGAYNPNVFKTSQKVRRPAFTIAKSPRMIELTRNCTL